MSPDMIGWLASAALVVTLAYQVFSQWAEGTSAGVSPWLFIGQLAASAGFTVYSVLIGNTVFIVTNGLIAGSAVVGLVVLLWHRRRAGRDEPRNREPDPGMLHHVGLSSDRWDRSLAFYTEAFGAKETLRFDENGGRVALLDFAGGCRIELFETEQVSTPRNPPPGAATDGTTASPGALVHFAVSVDDVDAATRRSRAAGGVLESPLERTRLNRGEDPDGPRVAYSFVRGPCGELIELIKFDPDQEKCS